MTISAFDLFKVGIGPSSSHTVGPMRAAAAFARALQTDGLLEQVTGVRVELYGSLSATGRGHGTDKAVLLGLEGNQPESIDVDRIEADLDRIRSTTELKLLGRKAVPFHERNAMGAVKALNAARLSLRTDGTHLVSLDKVIKTMKETGADMRTKYKETARGGLAVNVIEC